MLPSAPPRPPDEPTRPVLAAAPDVGLEEKPDGVLLLLDVLLALEVLPVLLEVLLLPTRPVLPEEDALSPE